MCCGDTDGTAGESTLSRYCSWYTILYSRSVDPRKLCVGIKYYIVLLHMYSMPYYTYDSTANFLFLEPTARIYIYFIYIYIYIYIKRTVL